MFANQIKNIWYVKCFEGISDKHILLKH